MILVGIDEAGYGPTLGPLVVSAAAFRIPAGTAVEGSASIHGFDLWDTLRKVVTRKPDRKRIPVNDSKKIYRPGKGLAGLEEGVLPFLYLRDGSIPRMSFSPPVGAFFAALPKVAMQRRKMISFGIC